ncbi:MAG TPA: hypothetical protein VMW67_02445 [Desulfobacteria bacterium]|nr:hypothetical protein [Desulfobacteria bacterium]
MRGKKCGGIAGSSIGMYIRNIADIPELNVMPDFGLCSALLSIARQENKYLKELYGFV